MRVMLSSINTQEFRKILLGMLGSFVVICIWKPFLNANGHLISFSQSSAQHYSRLDNEDLAIFVIAVLLQGFASGFLVGKKIKWLLFLTLLECLFPWGFYALWASLLAPNQGNFRILEELSWVSLPVVLNSTILLLLCPSYMHNKTTFRG